LPIQGEVKELVRHLTDDARTDAVRLIADAGLAVRGVGKHSEGLNGAGVLALAGPFVESGQLVNYIRAAEPSQAVITFYDGAAPEIKLDRSSGKTVGRMRSALVTVKMAVFAPIPSARVDAATNVNPLLPTRVRAL